MPSPRCADLLTIDSVATTFIASTVANVVLIAYLEWRWLLIADMTSAPTLGRSHGLASPAAMHVYPAGCAGRDLTGCRSRAARLKSPCGAVPAVKVLACPQRALVCVRARSLARDANPIPAHAANTCHRPGHRGRHRRCPVHWQGRLPNGPGSGRTGSPRAGKCQRMFVSMWVLFAQVCRHESSQAIACLSIGRQFTVGTPSHQGPR